VKPKVIYTIPTYQLPTGTCMSLERREQLVALADEWGVLVIEDNCYWELYYDRKPPRTLLSLDRTGLVVQSDSFSKIFAPGVRMGWIVGSDEALKAVGSVRQDLGVSQWIARALELYLRDGKLEGHLDRVRELYTRKRDVTLAALEEHCSSYVSFRKPSGGIYFWLELTDDVDWERVRATMLNDGVACRPGERFSGDDSGRRYLRVAFLQVPEEEIERGIAVMGRALRESVRA
jgi:2-aminoadipate transaminase